MCRLRQLAIVALALTAFWSSLIGCQRSARRPNILILSIESLRWDHLGVAGYSRPLSPNIDRLALRGTYFRRAYSQASWTRPSVVSTFTSTYESTHRVYGEKNPEPGVPVMRRKGPLSAIPDALETLAELFRKEGYHCFGWSSNSQLWKGLGFARGFDEYRGIDTPDPKIVRNLKKLFAAEEQRPFLVFAHFLAPHLPYLPAARFQLYRGERDGLAITAENYRDIRDGKIKLTKEDLEYNVALYDGAIQEVDALIGQVLAALRRAGLVDETIVVVMADHGEEFYDHGRVAHGHSAYDELIRVPLIFAGPRIPRGKTIDSPVQNVDILPSLLHLVSGSVPEGLQGNSLLGVLLDPAGGEAAPAFSENRSVRAVVYGKWKYVFDTETEDWELYDLHNDPYEQNDLSNDPSAASVRPQLASLLHRFLAANERRAAGHESVTVYDVPDEVMNGLKALGYAE